MSAGWTAGGASPSGATYGALIKGAVEAFPDRIAFRGESADISYRTLGRRISQLVQAFARMGLGKGDAVAVLSPNRPEYFMATVALALSGIRYTPLHPLGSQDDHRRILVDAAITTLIADPPAFGARAEALFAAVDGVSRLLGFGRLSCGEDLLGMADREVPSPLIDTASSDEVVAIAYTGGTTGVPKGVVLTHACVASAVKIAVEQWEWPREIVALLTTPISHAAGGIIPPILLRGGTIILQPGFGAERLLRTVADERVSVLFLVPTMIYLLLDRLAVDACDTSSLELVIYGAAPMAPGRLAEALERLGPAFMQVYGQVEASATICALMRRDHLDPTLLTSCGRPLAGHELALLGVDGAEVGPGEAGEICLRGPTLMLGYLNKPDETAEAFRGGWLHTGDIARKDERGYLHIVDRAKDMIISGGFNVYPREIEDVLAGHEGVELAAVIGVPDAKWGEAVEAFVVARPGADLDASELIDFVRRRKGAVHAPKRVTLMDALPLTPIGKIDKKAVRTAFWANRERQVS
jgi:fatty-acyl-CoA synthase